MINIMLAWLRTAAPLWLGSMGGLVSERAGVVDLGLEGKMLWGAFFAASTVFWTGSFSLGLLAGIGSGMVLSLVFGWFVLVLGSNPIVAGTALNLFSMGITSFLCKAFFNSSGSTPPIDELIPHIHPAIFGVIGVALVWILFRYLRLGLRLHFAGEAPKSLKAVGISPKRMRWIAVALSGALCGLSGAVLSLLLSSSFTRQMTAGRGYLALVAVILGRWRPMPTMVAVLALSIVDWLQSQLQGVILWGTEPVPVQWIQMFPYVLTLVLLAFFGAESLSPKALSEDPSDE